MWPSMGRSCSRPCTPPKLAAASRLPVLATADAECPFLRHQPNFHGLLYVSSMVGPWEALTWPRWSSRVAPRLALHISASTAAELLQHAACDLRSASARSRAAAPRPRRQGRPPWPRPPWQAAAASHPPALSWPRRHGQGCFGAPRRRRAQSGRIVATEKTERSDCVDR